MAYEMPKRFQKRVTILKSDPQKKYSQVNYIIKGLRERGHKVSTINSVIPSLSWVNHDNKTLLNIEACLMAIWIVGHCLLNKPDIIMSEFPIILLPILRLFTSSKVIQLHSNLINSKCWEQLEQPSKFIKNCYSCADEIIVPSNVIARFIKEEYQFKKEPHVLYPCVDIPMRPWEIEDETMKTFYKDSQVSLLIIDILKENQIFKVIDAFKIIHSRLTIRPKLMVVVKNFNKDLIPQMAKMNAIHAYLDFRHLKNYINIFYSNDEVIIHTLIKKSAFLINTDLDCYIHNIMLAMKYCKVVISTNQSRFASEILRNGYTGFLVENNAEAYAKAICCVTTIRTVTQYMQCLQLLEYRCKYAYRKFAINLNKYVIATTTNINLLLADDVLYHAEMRSAMFILRHCLAGFYITQIVNLPILYHYSGSLGTFSGQYKYMEGWEEFRSVEISTAANKIGRFNMHYMDIELGWTDINVTNRHGINEQEDAIGSFLANAITLRRRLRLNRHLSRAIYLMLCNSLCESALQLE